ncbi:MAG: DUF2380 domain-containing protein [Phycisphaerales bacterium]
MRGIGPERGQVDAGVDVHGGAGAAGCVGGERAAGGVQVGHAGRCAGPGAQRERDAGDRPGGEPDDGGEPLRRDPAARTRACGADRAGQGACVRQGAERQRLPRPGPGFQIHHDCPVEFQEKFLAHGIDINDQAFTRWVPEAAHRNILHRGNSPQNRGGAWNEEWRRFWGRFERPVNPDPPPTRQQVIMFIEDLRWRNGFQID